MGNIYKAMSKAKAMDIKESKDTDNYLSKKNKKSSRILSDKRLVTSLVDRVSKPRAPAPPQQATLAHTANLDSLLVVLTDPTSPEAENFRMLRTRILHPVDNTPPRSILITSTLPGEGKSFVSANLAAAIALGMEKHALLIDADLRNPTQAKIFGVRNKVGLVNHLRDSKDLSQLIQKTSLNKLSLITSGELPLNPSELLDSHKMSAMLFEAVSRYPDRFIVIDSPPLKAASETAVLAKYVDGVLLVVRWGQSKKEQVNQAVELIGREKIIGTVFNACPLGSIKDQYHGYYGYNK